MYKFLIFSGGMVFHHFKADKIKTSYACKGSPTTLSKPCPYCLRSPTPLRHILSEINLILLRRATSQESTHQTPKRSWSLRLVRIKKNFKSSRRVLAYSKSAQNAEIFLCFISFQKQPICH